MQLIEFNVALFDCCLDRGQLPPLVLDLLLQLVNLLLNSIGLLARLLKTLPLGLDAASDARKVESANLS